MVLFSSRTAADVLSVAEGPGNTISVTDRSLMGINAFVHQFKPKLFILSDHLSSM